ncbi:MAG: type VI secretion system baseplate subunit TssK [Polyangiales bacterium]
MRLTDKVAWAEGVLLLPQHFQQLDRYHESLLSVRLDAIEPACWGVQKLELDQRALQQGVVSLRAFEGVLPDGTPLRFDSDTRGSRGPKERSVSGHFPPGQKVLTVSIAIPSERTGVNNYGAGSDALRYALSQQKVADAARDDRHAEVQLALPNARVVFGDESVSGCVTLPIAELVHGAQGELVMSERFVPACLRIGASPVIVRRLEQLLRASISRVRFLSETRRVTGEGRVEFTPADVTRYLQLNALNTMLPALHHLARARDASPRTAYLTLAQLAGQLATFVPDADMTEPLDFDFTNLTQTFGALFDLCDALLAATDNERFVSCTLVAQEGGRFYADLTNVRIDKCERFLLAVESSLPRPKLVEELVQRAKVASHGDIEFVLTKNVGGIALAESDAPPTELPVKPGLTYFALPSAESDVYFRHVRKDRNLVVWLPPALDPTQVVVKLVGVFGSRL